MSVTDGVLGASVEAAAGSVSGDPQHARKAEWPVKRMVGTTNTLTQKEEILIRL